jgi:hypothetical protein
MGIEPVTGRNQSHLKNSWMVGILLLAIMFFGIGAGKGMKKEGKEIEATGRIYIVGHEPFTQVALEEPDGRVFILVGDREKELRTLQGKHITVIGILGNKTARGAQAIEVRSFRAATKPR